MLASPDIRRAIDAIKRRAERQEYSASLLTTFVDAGITARVDNANNQIVYGRRGTGKTHLLHVLAANLRRRARTVPVYIDLSRLGDTRSVSDPGLTTRGQRVTDLFRDLLSVLHQELLDYATSPSVELPGEVFRFLDEFGAAITGAVVHPQTASYSDQLEASSTRTDGATFKLTPKPGIVIDAGTTSVEARQARVAVEAELLDQVLFRDLTDALERVIDSSGLRRIVLLVDEWPSVSWDTQPVLAEFLRRCFFRNPKVTVKIASIEYRSNFFIPLAHNVVLGFELGEDIAIALELDDLFVFDRNPDLATGAFAELLYRHLVAELEIDAVVAEFGDSSEYDEAALVSEILRRLRSGETRMREVHEVESAEELSYGLFATPRVHRELVRAAEGVARDFISMAADSYANALDRGLKKIDMAAVRRAARDWFEQDKASHFTDEQRAALRRLVELTVGGRRARTFLLEKQHERDDMLRSLFDRRVIHLVSRGFADRTSIGLRYNIYTLDYGTYVTLLNTERSPRGDFTKNAGQGVDLVVPFEDGRKIQRLVLRPDDFSFVTE